MKESDKTRSRVVSAVQKKAADQNKARGRAEADRAVIVEDARFAAMAEQDDAALQQPSDAQLKAQHLSKFVTTTVE